MSQTELSFRRTPPPEDDTKPSVATVSQVVRGANRLLEGRFSNFWVEGEVSNLKVGGTGHVFFTLKDEEAALPVAMWRTSVERLRFHLQDGQSLRVCGRLGIFAKQGRFQMYADRAEPAGLGALMLELQQRKARLEAEGLFAIERKRLLPRWPRIIGVVTSDRGAAIHDILEVARRRCPCRILLSPAVVQGPEAPQSLVRALERLHRWPGVDVVIIGRGGGSIEDLWAFNDERLARAVAAFNVPVVSAVGHEVDVTICDLVADVRAATPSQAAELAVPDLRSIQHGLENLRRRMTRAIERTAIDERTQLEALRTRLERCGRTLCTRERSRIAALDKSLAAQHPRARIAADRRRLQLMMGRLSGCGRALPRTGRARLERLQARLVGQGRGLPRAARARLERARSILARRGGALPALARHRLARAAGALHALSPLAVLERGYAVVTGPNDRVLTRAADVAQGDLVAIRLGRGRLRARVTDVDPEGD